MNAAEGARVRECKMNALLFADDLVFIAENPIMLQKLLDALKEWCMAMEWPSIPIKP